MAQLTGYVGPQVATDTLSTAGFRQDKTGAMVVAQGQGAHREQVARGLVWAACIPPGTGQAPGTAIGTTACFTLANPAGSGINLVLLQINAGYISGTLGAGVLALLQHTSASGAITAPSGGTAITPTNMFLPSQATAGANVRFNNTVPASGIMIRAIGNLQASLASTAVAPWQLIDYVNGQVIIGPGSAVSVQGIAAAGSSPVITVGMVWAEESTSV